MFTMWKEYIIKAGLKAIVFILQSKNPKFKKLRAFITSEKFQNTMAETNMIYNDVIDELEAAEENQN